MFMRQAEQEFRDGDILQASEKGWGAAAHAVKAVAERRGWQHNSHNDLFDIAGILATERGTPEIADLFRAASSLHRNFYEGHLSVQGVSRRLRQVRRLLRLLEAGTSGS